MRKNQHIMYASSSSIEQIFHEEYGNLSQINLESAHEVSSSAKGKLSALVGSLSGNFSGKITKNEIHSINFDDDLYQTKKVINDLLNDSDIPAVEELFRSEGDWNTLYRFNSEVQIEPRKGEFEDDHKFVEVTGLENDVKFQGVTSLENWGSRSHLLNAMDTRDPYPFQGVFSPIEQEYRGVEQEEYRVQYLFICAPDSESMRAYRERQQLKRDPQE